MARDAVTGTTFPLFPVLRGQSVKNVENTAFPLFPLFPEQSEKNGTTFTAFPRQILKKACWINRPIEH